MKDRQVIEWDKDDIDALKFMKVDVPGARHALLHEARLRPAGRAQGHRARPRHHPGRGPAHLRDDPQGRHARHVPDREPGADVDAAADEAAHLLRPRHRGGDRPARPDPGRHGPSLSAAARGQGGGGLPEARAGEGARQDARRAAVPGAGDAGRDRMRRLHAGRGRPAPQVDGDLQVHRRRLGLQGQAGRRHGRQRLRARLRREDVQAARGLRQLRLPREPCRLLRADRLCLVLAEVPPSGRVLRRAAQRPADGLLRAGADRPRRARRTASRSGRSASTPRAGTARWSRPATRAASPCGSACAWCAASPTPMPPRSSRPAPTSPSPRVDDLWRRARVPRRALVQLAEADAFQPALRPRPPRGALGDQGAARRAAAAVRGRLGPRGADGAGDRRAGRRRCGR